MGGFIEATGIAAPQPGRNRHGTGRISRPTRNRHRSRASEASHHYRALRLEPMEERALLSVAMQYDHIVYDPPAHLRLPTVDGPLGGTRGVAPSSSYGPAGLDPQQILNAYGINDINYGSIRGANGAGQTIAIIDAYDDPDLVDSTSPDFATSDLYLFDQEFGLPDPPSFKKVNQTDGTSYPAPSGSTGWAVEESLDVEWAHAIAPQAKIILVEANSTSFSDMVGSINGGGAVQDARTWAGVSVISMSFGSSEGNGETAYDTYFTTPPGHTGITFLAATGDDGAPGEYPAYSPNVLAVGGTTLSTDANGDYLGEAAWAWNSSYSWAGGGGHSTQESLPSFQDPNGVALKYYATPNDLSLSSRGTPDVSFDADPLTGVAVRDSYDYGSSTPWEQVGGTSLATPCWAGLIAIADQLRAAQNVPLLNSSSAHSLLYSIYESSAEYAAAFHDVSGGNNGPNNSGFSAGTGYDLATGIGSPVANVLVPALVSTTLYSANMNSNPGWTFTSGGQWAWGPPSGSGGEPSSGYTGSNVVGYNLAGDYGKLTTTYWATTPAINCTGDTAVTLDFWRWLGVAKSSSDHAYIAVSNNGSTWTTVWQNPNSNTVDTAWTEESYDISAVANNQPTVYIRWGLGTTATSGTYCGWNIDDVTVMGLRPDIIPPTVTSVTPSVATVTDANVGTSGFALTVAFSAAMNTAAAPTISFPVQNPAGTLSFDSATSAWSNSTTYVARYDVTDSNTTLADIEVAVSGAQDAEGNVQSEGEFLSAFSIDTQHPTVTINAAGGQASPTTASPIDFTVAFSEAVSGFATGEVTLSGTAGATTAVVTGSGTTYNVAVSGMTASGTVTATVAAGVADDAAGNPNLASTSSDNTVNYVGDTPPVATVTLNEHSPQPNDVLTATATKADADGNPVTLTYVWTVNGTVERTFSSATALTDTFNLSTLGAGDVGDTVVVSVTPNDGILTGTTVTDTATVINTPRVTNVVVGSDAWSNSFLSYLAAQNPNNAGGYSIPVGSGAQLLPLPWTNIDEIKVTFNENVTVAQADLMLVGVNTTSYNVAGGTFSYNAATLTATWTLPAAIPDDKLLLELNAAGSNPIEDASGNRLDGYWTNPTTTSSTGTSQYPSGDGVPGGNFLFRFNVLPGDVNQDGYVEAVDGLLIRGALGSSAGEGNYSIFKDLNGDGYVLSSDGLLVLGQLGDSLPAANPVATAFPAAAENSAARPGASPALRPLDVALLSVAEQLENGGLLASLSDSPAAPPPLLSEPGATGPALAVGLPKM